MKNMSLTQNYIMLSLKEKVVTTIAASTVCLAGSWVAYKLLDKHFTKKQANLEFQAACKKGIENFFAAKNMDLSSEPQGEERYM